MLTEVRHTGICCWARYVFYPPFKIICLDKTIFWDKDIGTNNRYKFNRTLKLGTVISVGYIKWGWCKDNSRRLHHIFTSISSTYKNRVL